MKGILADINVQGQVEDLVLRMQTKPWAELWRELGLSLFHFDDLGLSSASSDLEIWQRCQAEQLILITDNRNRDTPDSLEETLRQHNTPACLPVFTIGKLARFRTSRAYAERVLEKLYEYLLEIDSVRGSGRLYLP